MDSRATYGKSVDLEGGLTDTHRHTLAILAAGADAAIKLEIVADHADPGEDLGSIADQCRPLDGRVSLPSSIR